MKTKSGKWIRRIQAAAVALAAAFAVHAQDDSPRVAPFVTTPHEVVERMLRLAGTVPGDTVLDLSSASVVTVYLLPFLIDQLQPKFLGELAPGARVVTHAFAMKGWRPDRSETVRVTRRSAGTDSRADASEIHLWVVPAQARGEWRSQDWQLEIQQNFQDIEVAARSGGRTLQATSAKLQGTSISFSGDGFSFRGAVHRDRIGGELTRGGSTVPVEFTRR